MCAAHETQALGTRITQARLSEGARRGKAYTQTELGQWCGVTPSTVSQWEKGASEPSLATIMKIAKALNVSPGWIAWGERTDIILIDETEG